MTEMSRNPIENLPLARHVLELAKDPSPGVIAASDQVQAFAKEKAPLLRQIADYADATYTYAPPTPMGMAWTYAVIAAVKARTRYTCIHYRDAPPEHSQIAWADLTLGVMTCEECFAGTTMTLAVQHGGQVPDDGKCDVCDRDETIFVAFNGQIGMWMVSGNQCDSCTEAMKGGGE